MKLISRKKAFTLIELLVVIAIIALLLSVILPSLQKVKRQARLILCATNLRSYSTGLALAAEMNNGKYIRRINNPLPSLLYRIDIAGATEEEYYLLVDSLYSAFASDNPDAFNCPFSPPEWLPKGEPGYFDQPGEPVIYGWAWCVRDPGGLGWYYSQNYNLFAGLDYPDHLDWSRSGNGMKSNQGPILSGSSSQVVVADRNDVYLGTAGDRWYAIHNKGNALADKWDNFDSSEVPPLTAPYPKDFEDAQAGYGDCHVARTTKQEDLHWVVSVPWNNFFLY